jgi:hypothetical protein
MVVESTMLLTVDHCCLDDMASALGSYNIEVMAKFFVGDESDERVRGTITLSGEKPAPREQREGLNKER